MPPKSVTKGKGKGKGKSSQPLSQSASQQNSPHTEVQAEVQAEEEDEGDQDMDVEEEEGSPSDRGKGIPKLTEQQEQALAEWYALNPVFFNQGHRHYRDKHRKERILAAKAKEFKLTG